MNFTRIENLFCPTRPENIIQRTGWKPIKRDMNIFPSKRVSFPPCLSLYRPSLGSEMII